MGAKVLELPVLQARTKACSRLAGRDCISR
jgi:hypothetical protein